VDDQHYISYALLSELDVLGINSIHHGGGQEPINYGEICWIIDRARKSGLPEERVPFVHHGADQPLTQPESSRWEDTSPIKTEASRAIIEAARGASPVEPVWVLPVGPCTNVASAALQARHEEFDMSKRIRIVWLGGGPEQAHRTTFNGKNDPWSVYVTAQSGLPFLVLLERPTGATIRVDILNEQDLYPDNPLGHYLSLIVPKRSKALFDIGTISVVIGEHLGKSWLTSVEPSILTGPEDGFFWRKTEKPTHLRVIRTIHHEAMKNDFYATLNGHAMPLRQTAGE
jgi:hypothetical protein